MRQAGVLAAAGIHALEHGIKRLADDHANARRLAEGLRALPGARLVREPETNIVLFSVDDVPGFARAIHARNVLINAIGPDVLRAVTHCDVSAAQVDHALAEIGEVLS